MGHEQRPRAGVKEGLGEAGEGIGTGRAVGGGGVAGRQDHQVGIEFEQRHLARGQEAVVALRSRLRRGQHESGLGQALEVTRHQPVGGEGEHAGGSEVGRLDPRFRGRLAQVEAALISAERASQGLQLRRRLRQCGIDRTASTSATPRGVNKAATRPAGPCRGGPRATDRRPR